MESDREPLIVQEQPAFSSSLISYLYVAHFLARWGARFVHQNQLVGFRVIPFFPYSLMVFV